jgi:hypothetical protein
MRPIGSKDGRVPHGGYPDIGPEVGGFLAGFLEGEACFAIQRQTRGYGFRCTMEVGIRADDAELLRHLARATRLGTVTPVPAQRTSRPQGSLDGSGEVRLPTVA